MKVDDWTWRKCDSRDLIALEKVEVRSDLKRKGTLEVSYVMLYMFFS